MPPKDSFNVLLISHLPRLRAFAMVLTRNHAAADDLLQETAYRALRAQTQFAVGTNFNAWMYRILRNTFISSLRSKKALVPIDELPEGIFSTPPEQEEAVLTGEVIRAMGTLRPGQRQVVELVCAGGMTYDEAAEAMACSVGTIKSRLWRARKHMELVTQDNSPSAQSRAARARSAMLRTNTAAHM